MTVTPIPIDKSSDRECPRCGDRWSAHHRGRDRTVPAPCSVCGCREAIHTNHG